ncbi:HlyD family secretion protein [Xanthobacter agilis]|uniref:HlyD family secretion protein n=1 Tax=Xanthobacter agilis TaxID=47492 RepID=A0ABU0LJT1_XANAG|nr:efflux RND transporter periplasmic adaptor subunit [Xanthobacter agilis]MDQ0507394.1 HlyD family secretion protein [Xanthobacter agilis]
MTAPAPKSGFQSYLAQLWAHRWLVLVALALATLGAWQAGRVILGPAVVVEPVQRGDLVQTVVASGHVETPYRVEIGAQITGMVADVLVEEGQSVTHGQPLVSIAREELNAVFVQAHGAVAQAEARLRQLTELTLPVARENLAQAQALLKNAQATFDRTSELANHGNATRAALDDAQRALDQARAQVNAAQFQVYTASPGGSDDVMARTQLDQANATLEAARSRLAYATITAPRDGVLISRSVERGTIVQPGRTLLVLAPAGDTQLVVDVDERNLGMIALGQPALASADAYPNQRFAAKVTYINPGIDITRATVEVKLTVPDPPAYLRQDMTVSVDIETARSAGVLVLPRRAIRDLQSGRPWVLAIRDGRAYRQPVTLGLVGNTRIEILDGLKAGDAAIPEGAGVVIGQRVRPVLP